MSLEIKSIILASEKFLLPGLIFSNLWSLEGNYVAHIATAIKIFTI